MLEEGPVLVEDITEEDEEEWVASLAPAPAPEPLPEEAVQVPALAAPEVEDEPGWISTYHFKYAPDTAYYHSLLLNMLEDYCSDFNATLTYYCAEHTHPLEATYWKIDLSVMIWNEAGDSQKVETVHTYTARRAQAMDSMEDVAQEAYI